ncbi:MAG TPA: CarD family transcriptional regulator [Candidatus Avimonas sp.]|jgi:CarD family transcriptional regulator|nr:CarD family transcriptional regulator [Clostridiales bacterium]HOB36955.1 CarD family transcriptional regulator [Candidatus Avimonas sp.]HQA16438.1 CarD family transcriptional regulator [Candidatus Avimonas sp.]HQD38379.1 CarD family transcriptional regulator [Candidatus Avimonas sp.]
MFDINEYVVYGTVGVCRVVDYRKESFGSIEEKEYYILEPVHAKNSSIYVPADNQDVIRKMQPVLTVEEVYELIDSITDEETTWISNDTQRREKFSQIIKSGNRKEILKLIKALYQHREERLESGRKLYAADENILNTAERLINNEFALVLNIEPEDVVPFIRNHLKAQ